MNDDNGAGNLPPPAGGACATVPEALRRFTVESLLQAAGSAMRIAFPGAFLLEGQVLAITEMPFGMRLELIEPQAVSRQPQPD